MMNARDALGYMEDMAIVNAGNTPRRAPDHPLPDESNNTVAAAALALKARTNDLANLRTKLSDTLNERHDQVAFARAAKSVIDSLVRSLAEATGRHPEDVQATAYEMLSRRYDKEVDAMIARRSITRDMRLDPELQQRREWYIAP